MPRKIDTTKPHYLVRHFYARKHEPALPNLPAVLAYLELRKQTSDVDCFTEVWQMKDSEAGERILLLEGASPISGELITAPKPH